MLRGYKFRLYPDKNQETLINKTIGSTRYIYNYFLSEKIKWYQETGMTKTAFDCCRDIKVLSKEKEWLKEVDSCALRCAVFDLEDAFKAFFRKQNDYPKYKSKYFNESYRTNNMTSSYKASNYNSIRLDLIKKEIILPKLKAVKIRGYRNLEKLDGRIINAAISKEHNRYYVSMTVEEESKIKPTISKDIVGIDLGIKSLVTTSDNEKYESINTGKYEKRLAHMQRELHRKEKGSKNYQKCKAKINTIYRKIGNTRKYYLHEISKKITDTYKVIVTEKLNVKKMLENSNLSKNIQNASFNELMRQLEYKAHWKGVKRYQVGAYYPSSQICSHCGNINKEMKDLSKREYECPECQNKIDRDYNAAINIMSEGINKMIEEKVVIV